MTEQNKKLYKLTGAQLSLLMAQIFTIEPVNARETSVLGAYFKVPENCDFQALEKAFNRVIEQNDALRLRIVRKGFGFYQYIEDYTPKKLDVVKIEDSQQAIDEYIETAYEQKMKMLNSDLVWAQMASFGTGGILLMRFHHFCVDGYSLSLIFKALERYYDSYVSSGEFPEEKTYSITQFLESDMKYRNSPQLEKDREFWKKSLNSQPRYKFPAGRRSELSASNRMATLITGERYKKLADFCRINNCSVQAAIMSFTAILTYLRTKADNFNLCSISHSRITPALKQTVGCMMSNFMTFFDLDVSMSLNEFARDSYMRLLTHMSHSRFPVDKINKYIFKESIKHFFNFFHQWIIFSTMDIAKTKSEMKYQAGTLPMINYATQFYCAIFEVPGESVNISLTYQKHKYKPEKIKSIIDDFNRLFDIALSDPEMSIEDLKNKMRME